MVYSQSGWQHLFRKINRTHSSTSIFIISKSTRSAPARTGLIFAVSRRGHGQDPEVILYHHRLGQGKGTLLWEEGVPSGQVSMVEGAVGGASSTLEKAAG